MKNTYLEKSLHIFTCVHFEMHFFQHFLLIFQVNALMIYIWDTIIHIIFYEFNEIFVDKYVRNGSKHNCRQSSISSPFIPIHLLSALAICVYFKQYFFLTKLLLRFLFVFIVFLPHNSNWFRAVCRATWRV